MLTHGLLETMALLGVASILGWIEDHTWGYLSGGWKFAVGKVRDAVHALAGWIQTIIGHVGDAWDEMVDGIVAVKHALAWFASEVEGTFEHVFEYWIPAIYRWVGRLVMRLGDAIEEVAGDLARNVTNLIKRIARSARTLTDWVLRNVWTPLAGWVKDLYRLVRDWAYTAWYYVSHPQRLAKLVWRHVVVEIAEGFEWTAKWLGHFVVVTFLRNLNRLVGFVESFLADLL